MEIGFGVEVWSLMGWGGSSTAKRLWHVHRMYGTWPYSNSETSQDWWQIKQWESEWQGQRQVQIPPTSTILCSWIQRGTSRPIQPEIVIQSAMAILPTTRWSMATWYPQQLASRHLGPVMVQEQEIGTARGPSWAWRGDTRPDSCCSYFRWIVSC